MTKIQTIGEMTEGMNEFQKFIFFSEKAKELSEFQEVFWLLYSDGGMEWDEMRKDFRISRVVWNSFFAGDMPLPIDLLVKIKKRYKNKIADCRNIRSKKALDKYFDYLRSPITPRESPATDEATSTKIVVESETIPTPSV